MDNRNEQGGALSRRPQGGLSRPRGFDLLTHFDPWNEMQEMRRRMDAMFNRFFGYDLPDVHGRGRWGGEMTASSAEPDADIYENDNEYIIQAALPGVNPHDIHVEATEDSIALSAETRSSYNPSEQQETASGTTQTQRPPTQLRQSRYSSMSRFQFSYALPGQIKPNEVRASFRNGMLELHLPKLQPTQTKTVPISIQVEGGTLQPSQIAGSPSRQAGTSGTPAQEGHPGQKMGPSYTPSGAEDHATRAQNIEAHQRRNETDTTPTPPPVSPGTTATSETTAGGTGKP
jgi:HSP20 family protein